MYVPAWATFFPAPQLYFLGGKPEGLTNLDCKASRTRPPDGCSQRKLQTSRHLLPAQGRHTHRQRRLGQGRRRAAHETHPPPRRVRQPQRLPAGSHLGPLGHLHAAATSAQGLQGLRHGRLHRGLVHHPRRQESDRLPGEDPHARDRPLVRALPHLRGRLRRRRRPHRGYAIPGQPHEWVPPSPQLLPGQTRRRPDTQLHGLFDRFLLQGVHARSACSDAQLLATVSPERWQIGTTPREPSLGVQSLGGATW
ncbi:hypothetical protein CTA1_11535 [Colletotrichum tanaceti]|uniref:Uncharacterized protein n=1 Tax=Colletotrichum tanaceti TaxID=1306861 RepID=A0A4U6XPH9_9PEZI|nr:hypothetical protein CTA1_11535 [Colletotrichum tanaceti]